MNDFESSVRDLREALRASAHRADHPEMVESVSTSIEHIKTAIGNGGIVIRPGKTTIGDRVLVIGGSGKTIREGDQIKIVTPAGGTLDIE